MFILKDQYLPIDRVRFKYHVNNSNKSSNGNDDSDDDDDSSNENNDDIRLR